jgi:hypothetical protein
MLDDRYKRPASTHWIERYTAPTVLEPMLYHSSTSQNYSNMFFYFESRWLGCWIF